MSARSLALPSASVRSHARPRARTPQGNPTATIYSLIKESRFADAIKLLRFEHDAQPSNRAALSLLASCSYHVQDYASASSYYEQLILHYPDIEPYRLHYAQSLFKAGHFQAAHKACLTVSAQELQGKVLKLQASIKLMLDDASGCKALIEQCPPDDPDTAINAATLMVREGKHSAALRIYQDALRVRGFDAELAYATALCHYEMRQCIPALKVIQDIIERGMRDHPELSVGMATEGVEVRNVANSRTLQDSFLVEAFNLKAAIEYNLKNIDGAREALTDMPPRLESDLDPVTLHNAALVHMDDDPAGGFEKLTYLLQSVPCPQEAFGNVLLLYAKFEHFDVAADLLAENQMVAQQQLSEGTLEYLEAVLLRQSSPEEAFKRFEEIGGRHIERLRRLTKSVQEARQSHDEEALKKSVTDYDLAVDKYITVLMAQAKIYWDLENYAAVERLFRKSVEFCNENEIWKLNVAHVLFMQENKYKEAISFYEPIVKRSTDHILQIPAIVLANLCVSYIMMSQNEEAEELMRKIEKEEERVGYEDPTKRIYHLCIVNLVIGTLYCAKGNYEFGISRIIKSLEPFNKKLGTDTWFYAKRCLASLYETLAKHMIMIKDIVLDDVLQFFDACTLHGRTIPVHLDSMFPDVFDPLRNNVAYEARLLKAAYLSLYD
ncbi:TPR-like protein [Gonapodya prolifera JEL478]|uniref:TPR-like protein n=1 Tax=Gonapodya prolifera (strain JEL478) TaxID=1344416 RepID=A0A139AE91_GONPJ|nr:TPR-like protein [Gonapodya prolifera JEL478]|eukprot:KXS15136.1 TPR-like protein [Gonapodya prolifera JEL478]